ncbi:hypothetical protein [Streptomyces sp. ID05-47C]|uniref:hypothetical protein n=1 Tax=Streptomyces sp. ID05-47C TaxID=3028665 RepID=UPI0029C03ECC|nr:hypothetical protein [Streptomyces sp. ID05-47C]
MHPRKNRPRAARRRARRRALGRRRGVLLGLSAALAAVGLAALAVTRPGLSAAPERALPPRRLQSGHIGDYVAWLLVGTVVPAAPALPGLPGL